ncbi:NADH-quinone oxidoreductase subunit NuoE [Alkaliphilus oremlandii]|uniref:NADH dehydrogenase (Ubiquinone) 24 kDa subunit n=1 Tax=Alkaliphilus oremlandii (strain OhILAs) TaxID=350688 RepID=A8ML21_ALKOO|nr:NADH-quinone oxidoreductase subunit NuoE [Alkaliphilus oremlandii]ABW17838.1 NADH dehydrogenase (ubiquinone) 24 kDa subunit [Alkaliphilus oremlandii OhILAs]
MSCCEGKSRKLAMEISAQDEDKLKSILSKYEGKKGSLISILQDVQEYYNYLPMDALNYISVETGIKPAKIHGVATFYTQFRLKPVGEKLIMLCQGTACHVNGSKAVEEAIKEELHIQDGETTEDNLFTLINVACLGCCSLSPVMMINDDTYGNLTPEKVKSIIREIKSAQ